MLTGAWSVVLRRILKQCLGSARSSAVTDTGKHSSVIKMEHGGIYPLYLSSSRVQESNFQGVIPGNNYSGRKKCCIPQKCSSCSHLL